MVLSTIETIEKVWIMFTYKLTIKTPEQRQGLRSGVFVVNFDLILHLFLLFLLLTLGS